MAKTIVKKAFDKQETQASSDLPYNMQKFIKFVLKAFNRLSYNFKIKDLLVASFFLSFSDYYILPAMIKTINIYILWTKFFFC